MPEKISASVSKYNEITGQDKTLKTSEEFDCERRGYKLTKTCLGSGAYARVKLAYVTNAKLEKDKRLADELKEKGTNKVAIKIISRKNAPKEYINKFMPREIESLHATYRCPQVIQLYETFRTEKRVYLVMEYASKGDLLEYINSRASKSPGIGETKAKMFFKQLVGGVQHCHRRNVVHRDLKCENILVDGEEEILKISDFGFATRFPTNKQKLLETFCGSYAYAAPEILQAEKYDGKQADIWSLGVILFAMINGRLPYNDRDVRVLVAQTKIKPRFSSRVNVTAACQDLVCKILTADPSKRASLSEIIRHPWMTEEPANDRTPRGIPDGKSDEVVTNEPKVTEEKYKQQHKAVYQNYTQRVLQRERWIAKIPEPQAIQKLLHSRATKSSEPSQMTSDKPADGNTKASETETILSRFWEERVKSEKSAKTSPVGNAGVFPNNHQAGLAVTKIAFGGVSQKVTDSLIETAYRLSPNKGAKKLIVCNTNSNVRNKKDLLKGTTKFCPGAKDNKCSLPPVNNNSKTKSNSVPVHCQQRSPADDLKQVANNTKIKQMSTHVVKQFKTKTIQNFSFNQPGVNVEVVNLRRNWQKLKQTAGVQSPAAKEENKGKNGGNNAELTYYTLSGKEVNVRDERRPSISYIKNSYKKAALQKC